MYFYIYIYMNLYIYIYTYLYIYRGFLKAPILGIPMEINQGAEHGLIAQLFFWLFVGKPDHLTSINRVGRDRSLRHSQVSFQYVFLCNALEPRLLRVLASCLFVFEFVRIRG